MYVVEWFNELYGPFASMQDAAIFAERSPVFTGNAFARGKVRPVLSPVPQAQQDDSAQRFNPR